MSEERRLNAARTEHPWLRHLRLAELSSTRRQPLTVSYRCLTILRLSNSGSDQAVRSFARRGRESMLRASPSCQFLDSTASRRWPALATFNQRHGIHYFAKLLHMQRYTIWLI